jgi:2-polyprenyl-3-methyl-5-hydroxy-6-metoxy-1,4-benzoquinol methylase
MKIHEETLSEIDRYLKNNAGEDLKGTAKRLEYESYLKLVRPYIQLGPETRMLEIGTGTGWFPIMCALDGLRCKGLEISPQLIEHAKKLGQRYGVEIDIELGNVEESGIGDNAYDVIIASSVFEHVEHWERGLRRVHTALKPGGVFLFSSTNKFAFTSGEYNFPLYGWLPDQWRYKLRMTLENPDVMKLGIDFNQFRHGLLRREFRRIGFSRIDDRIDRLHSPGSRHPLKEIVIKTCQTLPPLKALALTFSDSTIFVCVK